MGRFRLRIATADAERFVDLREGSLVVGRSAASDIVLDDPAASRQHLRVQVSREAVAVEDLGSRNGSLLEGDPLAKRVVWIPGQRLAIGSTTLVLEEIPPTGGGSPAGAAIVSAWAPRARTACERLGGMARALPLRARIGAAVGAAVLFAWLLFPSGEDARATPTSARLDEASVRGLVVGRGAVDLEVGERLEIAWRPRRSLEESLVWLRAEIEAPPGGLVLRVNDVEVARWAPEDSGAVSLRLPRQVMREDENLLALEAEGEGAWFVADLEVEEEPRPLCDRETCLERARQWLNQGREALERRAIDPRNLFEAWLDFRRARSLLEGLEPRPELYATAIALFEEAEAELDRECRRLRFSVVQSVAYGREDRALELARRMLRAFPGPEHPCHGRALDLVERLEPGGNR
ncbi:MAG: FHA domain-containing protein [Pseudomonadota bacterium]